ncbi:hypothetical protein PAMA_000767 [Pampus argenteus]
MALSALSGMKTKSLLFGVILGLFAVVHSTPVNTVTQIPIKAEDEFIQEAMTDEFLVIFPSHTTEQPKRNTVVQTSHQPLTDMEERNTQTSSGDVTVSNAAGETDENEHYATTSLSSTATVLPSHTDDPTSDSSTTQSPESDFTSSLPNVALSSITPDHSFLGAFNSDLGSGDEEIQDEYSATTSNWIIIVGFVVGLAALVLLCAAIATRDRWNRPNHLDIKTNPSDQQMEVEMETLVHKDKPMENGKAAEYTVIPLEELPEKNSH